MDSISDVSRASQIKSAVPIPSPLSEPLDIDNLFGFKDQLKGKNFNKPVIDITYFDKNRIFINQIDSFTGKYLVSVLSRKHLEINEIDQEKEEQNVTTEEPINVSVCEDVKFNKKVVVDKVGSKSKDKTGSSKKPKTARDKIKSNQKKSLKEPDISPLDSPEDLRYSIFDEKIGYDTSKLTVAEYFEMMDLEAGEPREEFLKDKLNEFKIIISPLEQCHKKDLKEMSTKEMEISDFEIVGTLINNEISGDCTQENIAEIIQASQESQSFIKNIAKCGVIIYNVIDNSDQLVEASWVLNSLSQFIKELKENEQVDEFTPPIFILLSTFMTWSLSKSLHPNIPDLPFCEKDYRKRKPHPNYQLNYELEEQVIRMKSNGEMNAVILTCGIPYGHEEKVFNSFFYTAFHSLLNVPVFYGAGLNYIPVIHVENIGQIVREVIKKSSSITLPFLFAKDPKSFYKKDVIKAITSGLGVQHYKIKPEQFSFLEDATTQEVYDQTMANVYMESCCPLFQEQDIKWKYPNGLVEDMEYIVKEYIDARILKPLNIVIYGCSLTSMEHLPQRLSQYYHSHYLNPDVVVKDYVSEMLDKLTRLEEKNIVGNKIQRTSSKLTNFSTIIKEEIEEYCEDLNLENSIVFFSNLNIKHPNDISKLTKTQKTSILNEILKKKTYLIHGYVLDDFPKTLSETRDLFSTVDILGNENFKEFPCLPDYMVYLKQLKDTSSEIENTVFENEENLGQETYYSEAKDSVMTSDDKVKGLFQEDGQQDIKRKAEVEIGNIMEEITEPKDKFSASEFELIHFFLNENNTCKLIKLEVKESDNPDIVFNEIIKLITQNEADGQHILNDTAKPSQEQDILQTIKHKTVVSCHSEEELKDVEKERIRQNMEANVSRLEKAEEVTVALSSCTYISYLINYLYPTLTNALLEVATQRPEDPLDFLAMYLFKNNPDGKMMDPTESKIEEEMRNKDLGFPNISSKTCLS